MSSDNLIEAGNLASQPVMVRHAEQGVVPKGIENAPKKPRVWKRAGTVAIAGVLFGFGASIWFKSANPPVQKTQRWVRAESSDSGQTPVVISVQSMSLKQGADGISSTGNTDPAEVERLKTRNRRLEALVQVLRKRSHMGTGGGRLTIKN